MRGANRHFSSSQHERSPTYLPLPPGARHRSIQTPHTPLRTGCLVSSQPVQLRAPTGTEQLLEQNSENTCTANSAQYWDSEAGVWRSTFETIDGESHAIDMFVLNLTNGMNELWVTEIDSSVAPSLYTQLQDNYVKLNISCPDENVVENSCTMFKTT